MLGALAAGLAMVALAGGSWAASARADGDPASDVLLSQLLFLPPDAGLTLHQQSELGALLSAAAKDGYPLRAALIASPSDLGSVTPLWRQPQSYAGFLGQELSLVYRGTLLVVMPDGFGLYGPGASVAGQRSALLQTPVRGGLGATAIAAVQRLAAAAGHPLSVGPIASHAALSSTGYGPLSALVIGAALIAAAWFASLRARPLRSRSAPASEP